MADFSKRTNYTEETSFNEVIFAKDSPLLEVEMNEMQEINKANVRKITQSVGDGFFPTDVSNYISYVSVTDSIFDVTLGEGDIVSASGLFVHIKNNPTIRLTNFYGGKRYIYAKLWNEEATFESDIKSWGNSDGTLIVNPIRDDRYDNETSRRIVTKYKIEWGLSVPSNTDDYKYVNIGYYTYSTTLGVINWTKFANLKDTAEDAAQQSLINKAEIAQLKTIGKRAAMIVGGYSDLPVKADYRYLSDVGVYTDVKNASAYSVTDRGDVVRAVFYCETKFTNDTFMWNYLLTANGYWTFDLFSLNKSLEDNVKYKFVFYTKAGLGRYKESTGFSFDSYGSLENCITMEITHHHTSRHVRIPISISGIVRPNGIATPSSHIGLEFYLWEIEAYDEANDTWVECDTPDTVASAATDIHRVYPIYHVSPYPRVDAYTGGLPLVEANVIQITKNVSGAPEFDAMFKDYNSLINKPSINSVTLQGNKTQQQLGIDIIDEMSEQELIDAFDSVYSDDSEENTDE